MTTPTPPSSATAATETPTPTPAPWTFDEIPTSCGRAFRIGSREIIDGHEASKSQGARTLPAYAVIYDDWGRGETVNKANTQHIVEAVNAYARLLTERRELVERVRALLDRIKLVNKGVAETTELIGLCYAVEDALLTAKGDGV